MTTRPQTNWWENAHCFGDDLFLKTDSAVTDTDLIAMRKTCAGCPVNAECLAEALERKEPATLRSGWTARDRACAIREGLTLTPGGPARTLRRRPKPPTTDASRSRAPWSPEDDALVLETGYSDDAELGQELGRSVWAIRNRRVRLRRAATEQRGAA